MKITHGRTPLVEAGYDCAFTSAYTDEKVTGLGRSSLALDLPQGEIRHGL
jgi:hypothetical protein